MMTYFDLYNDVKEMETADEIKKVIKKAVLDELAGQDFIIREQKRREEKPKKEEKNQKKGNNKEETRETASSETKATGSKVETGNN